MVPLIDEIAPLDREETLAEKTKVRLKSAIMGGKFRPGDKITLRPLAEALGVSITPAREALFNLVAEGILETDPRNRSVYVPTVTPQRVDEVMKIRSALETTACHEIASTLTSAQIEHLTDLNEQFIVSNAAEDFATVIRLNWEFHFSLYQAANMPFLNKMIENCWLRFGSYLNIIYPEFGMMGGGIENHRAIIAAAARGDGAELAQAVQQDIDTAAQSFKRALFD